MPKKLTQDEFITRAISLHGNKYDYSKVVYVYATTKVCIICRIHGEFWQTPDMHTCGKGRGCAKCRNQATSTRFRNTLEYFVSKSTAIHNNAYDYTKTIYVLNNIPVIIICKIHGEFLKSPDKHLSGQGCPKCSKISSSAKLRLTTNEFITKSVKIHGSLYDYSLTIYVTAIKKVNIGCKKHGIFTQRPNDHLNGRGCPTCKSSIGEQKITNILLNLNVQHEPQKRFADLKYVGYLSFDFYLPAINTAIEFDGIQHFSPVTVFGGDDYLTQVKKLDEIKDLYCKEKGIRLIRIPYWEINNIETIIKNAL